MDIELTPAQPAAVEIGAGLWAILPGRAEPRPERAEGLRSAALSALDRGALDVVVEPGSLADTGATGALDVLAALSDSLRARGGRLWLARAGGDEPLSFVPVGDSGLEPLLEARDPGAEGGGATRWAVSGHA